MTNDNVKAGSTPAPRFVDALEHDAFLRLEHATYLKGLLRPFKGKGDLEIWASQCESLRADLIALAQRMLAQATTHPFSLLHVVLAQQTTGAGVALRWRNAERTAMGVALWTKLIAQSTTPLSLVPDLFALEQQRIALNMQISVLHTLARQARDAAAKLSHAESVYRERIDDHTSKSP